MWFFVKLVRTPATRSAKYLTANRCQSRRPKPRDSVPESPFSHRHSGPRVSAPGFGGSKPESAPRTQTAGTKSAIPAHQKRHFRSPKSPLLLTRVAIPARQGRRFRPTKSPFSLTRVAISAHQNRHFRSSIPGTEIQFWFRCLGTKTDKMVRPNLTL